MISAVDVWGAGARRAWSLRRQVVPLQGLRAAALLGPELVGVWAVERWALSWLVASAAAWLVVEATIGAAIDRASTRVIAGERPAFGAARELLAAIAFALGRTVAPLAAVSAPAVTMVLLAGPPGPAMVTPVLAATVASLVAALIAVVLHLRFAVAYASGRAGEASRWARTFAPFALTVLALASTMRFGAAWAASAIASVAGLGWMGMVIAIAVVGVATRAIALATWAEAWRATTLR